MIWPLTRWRRDTRGRLQIINSLTGFSLLLLPFSFQFPFHFYKISSSIHLLNLCEFKLVLVMKKWIQQQDTNRDGFCSPANLLVVLTTGSLFIINRVASAGRAVLMLLLTAEAGRYLSYYRYYIQIWTQALTWTHWQLTIVYTWLHSDKGNWRDFRFVVAGRIWN